MVLIQARPNFKYLFIGIICLLALLPEMSQAEAAPYHPTNTEEVLEKLNITSQNSETKKIQTLQKLYKVQPNNSQIGLELAQAYFDYGQQQSDPRYSGYAMRILKNLDSTVHPIAEILLLKAQIEQNQHQFNKALKTLDNILKINPNHIQAYVIMIGIYQVLGDFVKAKNLSMTLNDITDHIVAQICLYYTESLLGQLSQSYLNLNSLIQQTKNISPSIQVWIQGILADMALRQNKDSLAKIHFEKALSLAPSDSYILTNYADLLLKQNKNDEVIIYLKNFLNLDNCLLRYCRAFKQNNHSDWKKYCLELESRFETENLMGNHIHQREEAYFNLYITENFSKALKLSVQNWSIQKEPIDTQLYLEACYQSNQKETARPVLEWIKQNHYEDQTLQPLIERINNLA